VYIGRIIHQEATLPSGQRIGPIGMHQ